jgi:hypothetical protein
MEFKISEIKIHPDAVPREIVILNLHNNPVDPFKSPIWERGKDGNKRTFVKNPAAFVLVTNKTELPMLLVTIHISPCVKINPGPYRLNGYYYGEENHIDSIPPLVFSGHFEICKSENSANRLYDVPVFKSISFKPNHFIGLSGDFHWCIEPIDEKIPPNISISFFMTNIELYWIHNEVDYQVFRRGVPVEILRYLAPASRAFSLSSPSPGDFTAPFMSSPPETLSNAKTKTGSGSLETMHRDKIVECIVKACFFRNPPRYDVWECNNHFMESSTSNGKIIWEDKEITWKEGKMSAVIFLEDYIKAIDDDYALSNCEDQAALLRVFLMAVGVKSVKICLMKPFGFLRLTLLVGRGMCNNPVYKGDRLRKIVYPGDTLRNPFVIHSFCSLNDNPGVPGKRIIDSCTGPHTGNEDIETYIRKAVDHIKPPGFPGYGPPYTITEYEVETYLDYLKSSILKHGSQLFQENWVHLETFMGKIQIDKKKMPKTIEHFVVCSWPDPRACPVLGAGWKIFYQNITAGNKETGKTWKLRKKGESIVIRVYVSSVGEAKPIINRFLSIGSSSTHHELPYEKGPSYHGEFSAKFVGDFYTRHFWIPTNKRRRIFNVFIDVTCTNVTFNVEALNEWLNILVFSHRVSSLKGYLPSICPPGISHSPKKPGVGEVVEIKFKIEDTGNPFIDFGILKGDGLCLINEYKNGSEHSLEFICIKESTNKLCITVVDKDTLLSKTKTHTICVRS